jgi:hypothetical protein
MTTIAIVTSTGNPTFDQVLRGVYGTATADPRKPGAVVFAPAPEFRGVSHLFTQLPQFPVRDEHIEQREVDDGDETIAKAQILFGLGARWASLYESRTRHAQDQLPDIGQALLAGERSAVASGVRQHLESIGMHVYEVPVLVKGQVLSHGSYVGSADELIQGMAAADRVIEIDPERRARVLVRSALSGDAGAIDAARLDAYPAEPPPAAAPAPTPARTPVRSFIRAFFDGPGAQAPEEPAATAPTANQEAMDQAQGLIRGVLNAEGGGHVPTETTAAAPAGISHDTWGEFRGIDATVRALVFVVAPDLQSLPRAVRYMQQAQLQDGAGMHLEPGEIASVRDLERDDLSLGTGEFDDSDFGDSGYRE